MHKPVQLSPENKQLFQKLLKEPPPSRLFTLSELADRTGVSLRNLQYLIEHNLVPAKLFSTYDSREGQGKRQRFSPFSGSFLCLGAKMLDVGFRSTLVKSILSGLLQWVRAASGRPESSDLLSAFGVWNRANRLTIDVADGRFLRVSDSGGSETAKWLPLAEGDETTDPYVPVIVTRLDLGELKTRLR
jgi:hypothetical protein